MLAALEDNLQYITCSCIKRAELNQGPADLQSAALTTELYTRGDDLALKPKDATRFLAKKKVLPRFELVLPDSESGVITVTPQDQQ